MKQTNNSRQALLQEFCAILSSVGSRIYPYAPKKPVSRQWARYDEAQENEYLGMTRLIRGIVDPASHSYEPVRRDAAGRECSPLDDMAKSILVLQYVGRSDRFVMGYLRMMRRRLGAHGSIWRAEGRSYLVVRQRQPCLDSYMWYLRKKDCPGA